MVSIMDYFDEVSSALSKLKKHNTKIDLVVEKILEVYKNNLKILVAGNGGSNADGLHFVGELVCTFVNRNRKPISAIELSSSQPEITAWSNDFSYKTFLERKIEAHGNNGDIAIFLSTSGGDYNDDSTINLLKACQKAKEKNIFTISLIGKTGGLLKDISDLFILVENDVTSIIQECHMSILHKICYGIEKKIQHV